MDKTLTNKRLRKTKLMAQFLQLVPFIRAILLNGSLAQGKSNERSDIDLLIIVKRGRLFTARLFTLVLAFLTGQKRSKDENTPHAGKFCFNYFLADNYLKIPTGRGKETDQYCADNYSKSVLVWGDAKLFRKFFEVNSALFKLATSSHPSPCKGEGEEVIPLLAKERLGEVLIAVSDSNLLTTIQSCKEKILSGKFGDWFEQRAKNFQIKMIERDPRTQKYPSLIVYNNKEARFHPPKQSGK